jgi:glycine C-acetyltransferase
MSALAYPPPPGPSERPDARSIQGRLEDPFDGYFLRRDGWTTEPGGLLDLPAARRWFGAMAWTSRAGLYSYQQAFTRVDATHVGLEGRRLLMLSSYDYLALRGHPEIDAAAIDAVRRHGTGTGGVRLLTGTCSLHRELEAALAGLKGVDAALALGSGYAANVGVIGALFGPRDLVLADQSVHRSILEGCRGAGVPVRTFRHNDVVALRGLLEDTRATPRRLIAVDGLYSMDGDVCPLPGIVALKNEHGAFLLVDEAHAVGVLGATGRGVNEHFGLPGSSVDLWTGSLSKAIPASGGYIAGSRELVMYLQHGTAPFMFSAALAPASAAAARTAIAVMLRSPERIARQVRAGARLREGLARRGWNTGASSNALVPVIVEDDAVAYALARRLLDEGVFASAIVAPAVPLRGARLRLCVGAAHSDDDIDEALHAFDAARR